MSFINRLLIVMGSAAILSTGCGEGDGREQASTAESCMTCHNGSQQNDYSGPGLQNPHPFGPPASRTCTTCHGGNPKGANKLASHIPAPPEIGDREQQTTDPKAWFNRLTLTGIDKFPDYQVGGTTYTSLQYLQFINPGDLRVVTKGQSCGLNGCHPGHAETVAKSMIGTTTGLLSGGTYLAGIGNHIPANQGLFQDTAADLAPRALVDDNYVVDPNKVGFVGSLIEFPVWSTFGKTGVKQIYKNPLYNSIDMVNDLEANGKIKTDSNLSRIYQELIAFTCGICHLQSAGANNRYGDYRSSGCTACHMPYSRSGRSGSRDPNVNKTEPLDPDDIDEPERPHIRSHVIRSVKKTLPGGQTIEGIDDHTCAGCHSGSNRTVLQYWGIRLDQNQDVRRKFQYPANPVSYKTTSGDTRLFDPVVGNNTFNGRNRNQMLVFEDYDGDGRDDTPADIHYEKGLGCIDCHGRFDLHGGDANATTHPIASRMEQTVAIQCESCHGTIDAYAQSKEGKAFDNQTRSLAIDSKGRVLNHVVKEGDGTFYLTSRLTGKRHYVKQVKDIVVNNAKKHPIGQQALYSPKASYAMGRKDGQPSTGIGPRQTNDTPSSFSHTDNMSCAACHSSWTNTCVGCHAEGEYDTGNNYSPITGDRIVFRLKNAQFVYQSPLFFQLGVNARNKIAQLSANTKLFAQYEDLNNVDTPIITFSDRNVGGRHLGRTFPSLSHNAMMAHSIRGKVDPKNEGPRYCVACHLNDSSMANFGTEYNTLKTAMATDDFGALDFNLLKQHLGQNPGNQLNSPLFVHMVAGLGTGLFLFDANGCPVNPLDDNAARAGCNDLSPKDRFNLNNVVYNLDRIVLDIGVPNGGNAHPLLAPNAIPNLRTGALNLSMAGPLGSTLIKKLTDPTTGVVLNSWIDADGALQGDAANFVK